MSYTLGAKNTQEGLLEINFKVDSKKFNEFILEAYKKNKNRFNIPGFRKGHAPFKMVEQTYGKAALYNDAIEIAFSSEYAEFLKKADKAMLDTILSRPSAKKIDISDNEELILDVEVAITPDVTLGEYTGLNIKRKDSKASEKEINDKIQQVRDDASKKATNLCLIFVERLMGKSLRVEKPKIIDLCLEAICSYQALKIN